MTRIQRLSLAGRDRLKRLSEHPGNVGIPVRLRSRQWFMTVALAAGLTIAGCGPSATLRNQQQVQPKADPFAVLDEQQKMGTIDPRLIEERLDAARQEWLRALAAQQRSDKAAVVRHFEESIETLNRLIYYEGVPENEDFQALTASVIEDYSKWVNALDELPQNASIFALKSKFDEEMARLNPPVVPNPQPVVEGTQVALTQNALVDQTISYFTKGNGRNYMAKWLSRTGKYFPMMKQIFKEEGVPEELIHLSMIESGLSPTAQSWASAVGLWQFIQGTGSRYALHSNWWYDRRRDPVHATRAAAQHLRDLNDALGDWHLALASYNAGINRIRGAMTKSGSRDFWVLRSYLPKETQNYVPLYIAATLITRDPANYGFHSIQYEAPMAYDTVFVKEAIDLHAIGKAAGVSGLEIKELNPELLQGATPPVEICGPNGYCLKVPVGTAKVVAERLASIPADQKMPWMSHTVQRRETLKTIARTYGLSVSQLADYNNMSEKDKLRRGSKLRIPMSVMVPQRGDAGLETASTVSTAPVQTTSTKSTAKSHTVKKGETLYSIANKYGMSVGDLKAANNLSSKGTIRKGQVLKVGSSASANIASGSNDNEESSEKKWVSYKVRKGDTMGKIADAFDVTVKQLQSWNPKAKRGVKQGQTVKVYTNTEYAAEDDSRSTKAQKGDNASRTKSKVTYRVKRGDTLSSIAGKYGVTTTQLKSANSLKGNALKAGQRLRIPQ